MRIGENEKEKKSKGRRGTLCVHVKTKQKRGCIIYVCVKRKESEGSGIKLL